MLCKMKRVLMQLMRGPNRSLNNAMPQQHLGWTTLSHATLCPCPPGAGFFLTPPAFFEAFNHSQHEQPRAQCSFLILTGCQEAMRERKPGREGERQEKRETQHIIPRHARTLWSRDQSLFSLTVRP